MKIYLPSWNGDMRLQPSAADPKTSVLILHEPTPHELMMVAGFLRTASKKNWWDGTPPEKGSPFVCSGKKVEISISAPLSKASKELIKVARPKDRTLTAVKFADGKMEVVEGASAEALTAVEETVERATKSEKETKGGEAAAASVKRPTPCCPQCLPGAVGPASEVLLSFLSSEQHDQWMRERAIVVEGQLSGHRYLIAHRHTPLAQRIGRVCFDVDDQEVVHFHDWSVPPEEEVLAAKLIMENAEPWLRNEATMFGLGNNVYANPFGGSGDGTESASFARGFGRMMAKVSGLDIPSTLI